MYRALKLWATHKLLFEKLNNPIGYLILTCLSIVLSYLVAVLGIKYGALLLGAIIGVPLLGLCLFNHQVGIFLILSIAFITDLVRKYVDAPVGTLLDALNFVMFFGLIVIQSRDKNLKFAKSPISIMIILWIIYNFIQVLNPMAASKLAWVYTVRSMAGLILLYFIACHAFKSKQIIYNMIKIIIGLAFISSLYGLKQEFFGFTPTEIAWLYADEERFQLIVQWSRFRIFSFCFDPTTYGILMGYMGVFCFILSTGPFKMLHRVLLFIGGTCMFLSMAYAGSRTPFVLVPFGFLIFLMLTMKKKYAMIAGIFFVLGTGLMLKSTSSAVMWRIQSTFNPNSKDTLDVRLKNQKKVQPYIQAHPFGAGMGSTGAWGKRFTPNSWLASFAHDSGFVRIAVEMGWVGLILYMIMLYTILRNAIYYYLRVKNPQIKTIYLGLTTVMFILALASYPQEAIVLLPTSIIFYVFLACIVRLKDFDEVAIGKPENTSNLPQIINSQAQKIR